MKRDPLGSCHVTVVFRSTARVATLELHHHLHLTSPSSLTSSPSHLISISHLISVSPHLTSSHLIFLARYQLIGLIQQAVRFQQPIPQHINTYPSESLSAPVLSLSYIYNSCNLPCLTCCHLTGTISRLVDRHTNSNTTPLSNQFPLANNIIESFPTIPPTICQD